VAPIFETSNCSTWELSSKNSAPIGEAPIAISQAVSDLICGSDVPALGGGGDASDV
jgi:hypothetical protein